MGKHEGKKNVKDMCDNREAAGAWQCHSPQGTNQKEWRHWNARGEGDKAAIFTKCAADTDCFAVGTGKARLGLRQSH
jgi:hypothetical protein